eukprot:UC1_evm1s2164
MATTTITTKNKRLAAIPTDRKRHCRVPLPGGLPPELLTGEADAIARWNAIDPWHATVPALVEGEEIALIGDVHGCYDELREMVDALPARATTIIVVGDLVNKGPDSIGCVRLAMSRGLLCLRGNHEEAVLTARAVRKRDPTRLAYYAWADALTDTEAAWLASLPFTYTLQGLNTLCVHAGLVPGVPLEDQAPQDMVSMRDVAPFLVGDGGGDSRCHHPDCDIKSGHKPMPRPWAALENPGEMPGAMPWAKAWQGPMHVVFGHDARRGLQLEPFATGLDTGCLYGRELTCMLLPSRHRYVVPARAVHVVPGGSKKNAAAAATKAREGAEAAAVAAARAAAQTKKVFGIFAAGVAATGMAAWLWRRVARS